MKDNGSTNEIILFPEYQTLKEEIKKLQTELSMLLLERDDLRLVKCKNIENAYILAVGNLEYKAFELQCKVLRIKRKIDIIQTRINRQEKIIIDDVEKILDQEFEEYQQQLNDQLNKINDAISFKNGNFLTQKETKELKKLYRDIVKELHPDLHPDITDAQMKLFHNAVSAYENGDLVGLKIIHEMVVNPKVDDTNEDSLLNLKKEKERLKNILNLINYQIKEIKSNYPYTMKDIVEDPQELEKKKNKISKAIEELKEIFDYYSKKLKEMLV